MNFFTKASLAALTVLLTTLAFAGTALAAAPAATTVGAEQISSGGATLVGRVDPNNEETTYYFEYGTTTSFGSRTDAQSAGSGANARRVTAAVQGLAANTRYYFRLVASNASGVVNGARRSFVTARQPLGLQIGVAPNPVVWGQAAVITGALTGTGNARRDVIIQARPFPYVAAFVNVNTVVTDDNGNFSLQLPPQIVNTQYQAQLANGAATSPIITQATAVKVTTNVTRKTVRDNSRVTFYGRMYPGKVDSRFQIQKLSDDGNWFVVGRGLTKKGKNGYGKWSKRIKITRTARYRVFIDRGTGNVVPGFGREIRVRVRS